MRTCASLANSLSLAGVQAGAGQEEEEEEEEKEEEEKEAGAARRSLAHWRPLLATLLQNTFL
jgi:ribosomal protein L12E/L44/L45/RPP1/RPP2